MNAPPLKIIPYGATGQDGKVCVTFTLPVKADQKSRHQAKVLVEKMGFKDVEVESMESMGPHFSHCVVKAVSPQGLTGYKSKERDNLFERMTIEDVERWVKDNIKRCLHIVSVCLGREDYTIGGEALLTAGGVQGHLGLEAYPCFQITQLRNKIEKERSVDDILGEFSSLKADIGIISFQNFPQDSHVTKQMKALGQGLKKSKKQLQNFVSVIVGPQMEDSMAHSLGYDLGFEEDVIPLKVVQDILYVLEGKARGHGRKRKVWQFFKG